jgi:hypothetical protein
LSFTQQKVGFIIIGAQKCATTSLSAILGNHPDIAITKDKEPHFFAEENKDFSAYHQLFSKLEGTIWGERSTMYTAFPHLKQSVVKPIFQYNPHMKFIYMVRNPLDRFVSHYMHLYQKGRTNLSIEMAADKHPILIDCGKYATQITPYIEQFGKENILMLDFEKFIENRGAHIELIGNFLNVEAVGFEKFEGIHENKSLNENITPYQFQELSKSKVAGALKKIVPKRLGQSLLVSLAGNKNRILKSRPRLSKAMWDKLMDIYLPEIERLESITGWNLEGWRQENY